MSKPVIFTISAAWDQEASVWSGHCDDIPAAADAPTLDELLAKISAILGAATIREQAVWVTGMVVAGVIGTAICADLGARKVRDELNRTWARETRLEREQKGLKGYTPQLTGKYAKA